MFGRESDNRCNCPVSVSVFLFVNPIDLDAIGLDLVDQECGAVRTPANPVGVVVLDVGSVGSVIF